MAVLREYWLMIPGGRAPGTGQESVAGESGEDFLRSEIQADTSAMHLPAQLHQSLLELVTAAYSVSLY